MTRRVPMILVESVMKEADIFWDSNDRLLRPDLPDGAASWMTDTRGNIAALDYVCPCGCKRIGILPIKEGYGRKWTWDGNKEKPTLGPSIFSDPAKGGCGYHGYLIAGEFQDA